MPDKKLTNSEIVKALEELLKELKSKKQLIVPEQGVKNLCYGLQNFLDLINRLQAENERLKEPTSASAIHILAQKTDEAAKRVPKFISEIKAEAYKDILNFLECRFVCKGKLTAFGYESAIIDVKNHLKEFVGDDNVD